jgi:2-methylaconitate cis-trans-isomerase PrpF
MGGGISSLSKVCVVGPACPSRRTDAQVEFTFAQVGIRSADVDYAGNCGNMSSAVGPFAVDAGLVPQTPQTPEPGSEPGPGTTTVKLYNTNTQKRIDATFPVTATGTPQLSGSEFAIDGVAGTAGRIRLDFVDPAGSKTGSLLPTGRRVEEIQGMRASCVDVGNPCVFVHASEPALGLAKLPGKGHLADIRPEDLQAQPGILDKLESVRQHATVKMGMASSLDEVPASIPKICIVDGPPPAGDGEVVDVTVRAISTQQPHKALPITAGLALSAAARLEGTVVHECLQLQRRGDGDGEGIRIGHPSGKLEVGARYVDGKLQSTTVYRTARRLMEGCVYVD